MAELFGSLAQFKEHVGGAISQSVEIDSLAPVIADTARRHLVPHLSLDFYESLVNAHAGTPSAEEEALLPYVQRALALLTMHEYTKVGGILFTEGGIHRVESETHKSAFRYQEAQYSEYAIEKGYDAIEEMLRFLGNNVANYSDWAESAEGEAHLSLLFNYAADFRTLLYLPCDRHTFEHLRPLLAAMEQAAVEPLLPAAFWIDFKTRYADNDLGAAEKALLKLIRKAIGHKAMEEASLLQMVHTTGGRIVLLEQFGEQSQINRTSPTASALATHHRGQGQWADRWTQAWVNYIKANAEDFPLVFDEASGGTNADADAWHINTDTEQATEDAAQADLKDKPVIWL